uniref:EF-hand domain-containing protein n=2 Tax=Clytia hemisphaerica TaxID=252671 RepID=A0A7M5V2B7_9CNID
MTTAVDRYPDVTHNDLVLKGTPITISEVPLAALRNKGNQPAVQNNGVNIGEGTADQQSRDLELIERRLMSKIVQRLDEIKRACHFSDVRGNGWIRIEHLRNILSVYCFDVDQLQFQRIMDRWGFKARNLIGYSQFLQKFNKIKTSGVFALPYQDTHWYNPVRGGEIGIEDTPELFDNLKKLIHSNHATLKTSFLKLDESRIGYIGWKEFRRVLSKLSITITEDQFTKLMKIIDPNKTGRVSYHQFLNLFEERETLDGHPWLKGSHIPHYAVPAPALDQPTVEKIIREKIQDNWTGFTKAFLQIDLNQDGLISKNELAELLQRYAIPMKKENFDQMWRKCDANSDGDVEFYEFMERLGVNIHASDLDGFSKRIHDEMEMKSQARKKHLKQIENLEHQRQDNCVSFKSVDEVLSFLKDFVIQRSSDFRQTFMKFDHNGDGKLSIAEFRRMLKQLKINLNVEDLKELLSRFKFFNGKLTYTDFLTVFQDIKLCGKQDLIRIPNHRFNQPIVGSELPEEEIFKKFKQKICENSELMFKTFKYADKSNNNSLSRTQFMNLVNTYIIPITREQMEKLFTYLGLPAFGSRINYMEFLNKFEDVEDFKKGHPWLFTKYTFNDSRPMNNVTAEKAFKMLAEKATDQWLSLAAAYRNFNRDFNGLIDEEELHGILKRFNIPIEGEEFQKLWKMFDTDGDGNIDNQEFLNKLGTELAPGDHAGLSTKIAKGNTIALQMQQAYQRERVAAMLRNQKMSGKFITAEQLKRRLRDKFRDGFESFKKAFRNIDKNMDGSVSKDEFVQVLNYFHYYIDEEELQKLMESVGLNLTNSISYTEFFEVFGSGGKRSELLSALTSSTSAHGGDSENEELCNVLRKMVSGSPELFEKAFETYDDENLGYITTEKLHILIKRTFMNLSKKQFQAFLTKIGLDGQENITCALLLEAVMNDKGTIPKPSHRSPIRRNLTSRSSLDRISLQSPSQPHQQNIDRPKSSPLQQRQNKAPSSLRRISLQGNGDSNGGSLPTRKISFQQKSNGFENAECASTSPLRRDSLNLNEEVNSDNTLTKRISFQGLNGDVNNTSGLPETSKENLKLPALSSPDMMPSSPEDNSHNIEILIRRNWQKIFKLCRKQPPGSDRMKIKTFCDVLREHGIYVTIHDIRLLMKANCMEPQQMIPYVELLKRIVKKQLK